MTEKELYFEFEKETKNKIRFTEIVDEGTPPVVETIYLPKWYVQKAKKIKVTISEAS